MGRSEIRQHIFMMLFRIEFNREEEMPDQLRYYFAELNDIKEADRVYIEKKYELIAGRRSEIDQIIDAHITGWKTSRMNKVDLTILRLAVYEIKWDEDIPTKVAINEAVELAKKFSGDEGPSFINGVLAKLAG